MRLRPLYHGAFTQWRIRGVVPTAIPRHDMSELLAKLSFWSGWPVEVMLPVEIETAAWLECWTEAVADFPGHRVQVRFIPRRPHLKKI